MQTTFRSSAVFQRWRSSNPYLVSFTAAALAATLLTATPAVAAPPSSDPAIGERSVKVSEVESTTAKPSQTDTEMWKAGKISLPKAGSADLVVSADQKPIAVGGLPVTVSPAIPDADTTGRREAAAAQRQPSKVRVAVVDPAIMEKVGTATALRVSRADGDSAAGSVRLTVSYDGLAGMYGAAWGSRVRLVQISNCTDLALSTGDCQITRTDLKGLTRDGEAGTIAADVPLAADAPTMVALMADAVSANGTFAKTSLAQSYSWAAGESAGDFNWSYPITVPPAPGGFNPQISLNYNSGAVDGQTNGENTQTSWLGEGWSYEPGYVERSYRPCKDDLAGATPVHNNATNDLCWRDYNLTMVLNGKATELVRDNATGKWRLMDDNGAKVEYVTGSGNTGNWQNERWKITMPDGSKYHFGWSVLDNRSTNSVLGAPVFGNHAGEPCLNTGSFAASWCSMAYRWNLDLFEDPNGNAITYFYTKKFNYTALANNPNQTRIYDRAAVLDRIEYGAKGWPLPATPPMQVRFSTDVRCLDSCGTEASPNGAKWPDTPWDLRCGAGSSTCSNNIAPSFWSTSRLTKITAEVAVGSSFQPVDEWNLTHQFPETGESDNLTSPALWLASITRTGRSNGSITYPPVTFGGTRFGNRTDYNVAAGAPQTNKYRITQIGTEAGASIDVTYEGPDCTITSQPAQVFQNSMRCFPQYYAPPGSPGGWSWWNKYRVRRVVEKDLVGGSPDIVHAYDYNTSGSSTNVLWGHNDNAWSASLPYRSWSDFRGWPTVIETTGTPTETQEKTVRTYFRGLHKSRTDAGEFARTATITDSHGTVWNDELPYRGFLLEEQTYDSVTATTPVRKERNQPWLHQTAQRDQANSAPSVFKAHYLDTGVEETWDYVAATNSWRKTEVRHQFDTTFGQETKTTDLGDVATDTDDTCTTYAYARNEATWHLDYVSEEITTDCSAAGTVLSGTRTSYDGKALHVGPTAGNETKVEELTTTSGGWETTAQATYDPIGRPLTQTDGLNRTTTTTYTPSTASPTTSIKVKNPAEHETVTNLNLRGQETTVVDANTKTTTTQYDALGRITKVWLPGRATSTSPNVEYVYGGSKTVANWVQTIELGPNGNAINSWEIYDGLLRLRQSQSTAPDSGRTVSDVRYDSRGYEAKKSEFFNASAPSSTLVTFTDAEVGSQTRFAYDGQGRVSRESLWSLNAEKSAIVTTYDGDRVNVDPPTGGTPTTTLLDVSGNPTALRQYTGAAPTGTYDETTYAYDRLNRLVTVTDPAGNDWTSTYDPRGRALTRTTPDSGTTSYTYDAADQVVNRTDARNVTLTDVYDSLGRVTERRQGTTVLAAWTFDTVAKGQPASSTRYHNGNAYTSVISSYDDGYRPLSTTVVIPAAEGALAGTYTNQFTYKPDGSPNTVATASAAGAPVGGLPLETLQYGYSAAGDAVSVSSQSATYVSGTSYTFDRLVAQQIYGATANQRLRVTNAYDPATRRLTNRQIDAENATTANTWDDKFTTEYGYDATGNVTAIAGKTAGARDQVECYSYDHLRRLTQAWTEADWGCTTPQRTGADPYRLSWTYDKTGNRTTQTSYGASASTTDVYTYPAAGGPKPHTVTSITDGTGTDSFTYDAAGNTTGRTVDGATQTLTWDAEGHLATVTQGTDQHGYVYDAAGTRLLRRAPGTVTLYLPDGTELKLTTASGQVDGSRYYTHNGETVGVRTVTGLTRQFADHHGTSNVAVAANATITRRRSLPFGESRGTDPTWTGDRGFVGGTRDSTGLTHLGAREYDPATGRFISQDPVIDFNDPQQTNGYAYSNNSPATFTDPDGLRSTDIVTKRTVKKAMGSIAKKPTAAKTVAKIGTKKPVGGSIGRKKTVTPVKKIGGAAAKKSASGGAKPAKSGTSGGRIGGKAVGGALKPPVIRPVSAPPPSPPGGNGPTINCGAGSTCNFCMPGSTCTFNNGGGGTEAPADDPKAPEKPSIQTDWSIVTGHSATGALAGAVIACVGTLELACLGGAAAGGGAVVGGVVGAIAGFYEVYRYRQEWNDYQKSKGR